MHNRFIGCYHRVGLRSLCIYKVGGLYILVWFRVGLGFEHHLDDNANLLDR